MSDIFKLFDTPAVKDKMQEIIRVISMVEDSSIIEKEKIKNLSIILEYILGRSADFDKYCQINIMTIGSNFKNRINAININSRQIDIDYLLATIYRFVVELELSFAGEVAFELRVFQSFIVENVANFPENEKRNILFAGQQMSISIVKNLLHDDRIGDIRNVPVAAVRIAEQINRWDQDYQKKKKEVDDLNAFLEKHKVDAGFIAFDVGFGRLAKAKKLELIWGRVGLGVFGIMIPIPLFFELFFVYGHSLDFGKLDQTFLISSALISLSMTLLILYFFRIILGNFESCKSQILQLELRRELCRFVQDYVGYAEQIKKQSPESLAKFESLIFSRILTNNDQALSMFDGIDKIGEVMKAYKS